MNDPDSFLTLDVPGTAEIRVLGSRFFGVASPLNSMEGLSELVEHERAKHYDATHWCFAARAGIGNEILERASDAGEPKGTAGIPMLKEISGRNLTNCAVIVSRYFGGTKLGTGNLARAYSECAAMSLDNAHKIECRIYARLSAACAYDDQGILYRIASKWQAIVEPLVSAQGAVFEIRVARACVNDLRTALRDESAGRIHLSDLGLWISS